MMGRKYKRLAKIAAYLGKRQWLRTRRWWRRGDKRYGVWWRVGNGAAAVLILLAVVIPVLQQISDNNSYRLSADALKLVGHTDPTLTKQLTYDGQTSTYQFNKDAVKSDDTSNPLAHMQAQVGTADGKGKNKSLYALDVPTDMSKGVTYHDINSQTSFSLVPEFTASAGKDVDGHLVFPLNGGNQAIYTLKNNGLKEDIVVPKATADTMTFSYKLDLPATLQAKVIPDSDGAIGIYSGDPSLFGNITYGSDKDRAAVEKAREKAEKTYLVFGLPAPVIKDTAGREVGSARFVLQGQTLQVVASGLSGVHTAVTIDPSVVITATSDFQTGNNEGNIDFSPSDQITRGALTGGSISAGWSGTGGTGAIMNYAMGEVAYNGYLYQIDGAYSGTTPVALYAPINSSDGTVGNWTSTTAPNTGRIYTAVVAYNGYMYMYGGYNVTAGAVSSTVEYVKINSDGTLGSSWATSANTMTYGVCRMGYAVYNGYLYATGGANVAAAACANSSTPTTYVQYAPLNADGSVGSWVNNGNQFATVRTGNSSVAYNGYLYVIGGAAATFAPLYGDVQYAPLNADGSVGSWVTTATMPKNRALSNATAYNGYMYVYGGSESGGNNAGTNDTIYAQINANGTLGPWQTTASFTNGRFQAGGAAYNGYLYLTAGYNSTTPTTYNDTQYAKIDPAGVTGSYSTSAHPFTTTRRNAVTLAYNGFLYIVGGQTSTGSKLNTVYYASISTTGDVGTWTSTSAFINARYRFAAVVYNGYMYIIGGALSGADPGTDDVQYAPINTSGTLGAWHYTHNSTDDSTTYVSGILGGGNVGLNAVVYNGYLYALGGQIGGVTSDHVQYAPLNANGTVGTWHYTHNSTDDGTTFVAGFTNSRWLAGAVVNGGYVYIVGGLGASYYNDVQYAPLNANGTVGTWHYTHNSTDDGTTFVAGFTTARTDFQLTILNGYLYLLGGHDGTSYHNDVQYAPLNANGTVGTWSSTRSFTTARRGMTTTVYNGYLYVLGGYDGTTYYNDVQYAPINNGGSGVAGSWTTNTDTGSVYPLSTDSAAIAYNGYFYLIAGDGTTKGQQVYFAPLNADGSLGAWAATTSLNVQRGYPNVAVYNGYLYAYAGYDWTNTTANNTVEYAPINSNGTVGSWTTSANTMPTAVCRSAYAQYNGYLYALGGTSSPGTNCGNSSTASVSTVQYAHIKSDGSVDAWSTTNDFTYATGVFASNGSFSGAAVAYGGYLYMMGGTIDGGHLYSQVQYAPINSNGTVGSWVSTVSFPVGNYRFGIAVYNGYIYLTGGNTARNAGTLYAPINSNGSLGGWSYTTDFSTGRSTVASAAYNGYLYISSGASGAGSLNDTQYTSLNTIARTGHYSNLIDLGAAVNVTSVVTNPASNGVSVKYKAAGSNGVFGSSALASAISGTGGCLGTTTNTRYLWVLVTLDDSYGQSTGGTFPDVNGVATPSKNANLTDFTVNYSPVHPPPNIRLRAGQTLQQGNLSALDTCYP